MPICTVFHFCSSLEMKAWDMILTGWTLDIKSQQRNTCSSLLQQLIQHLWLIAENLLILNCIGHIYWLQDQRTVLSGFSSFHSTDTTSNELISKIKPSAACNHYSLDYLRILLITRLRGPLLYRSPVQANREHKQDSSYSDGEVKHTGQDRLFKLLSKLAVHFQSLSDSQCKFWTGI